MWIHVTKEEQERNAKAMEENFRRMQEEQARKIQAREAWVKANTCPHFGRTDPIPPWLL